MIKFWASLTVVFFVLAILVMALTPTPHYSMLLAACSLCFGALTMRSYEDYLAQPYRW